MYEQGSMQIVCKEPCFCWKHFGYRTLTDILGIASFEFHWKQQIPQIIVTMQSNVWLLKAYENFCGVFSADFVYECGCVSYD